jgi:hypothetical protein
MSGVRVFAAPYKCVGHIFEIKSEMSIRKEAEELRAHFITRHYMK